MDEAYLMTAWKSMSKTGLLEDSLANSTLHLIGSCMEGWELHASGSHVPSLSLIKSKIRAELCGGCS